MQAKEIEVDFSAAERYDASKSLAQRYIKDTRLDEYAWQWAVWFIFNNNQCATKCPYRTDICCVGSDTCCECDGFEGIQILTKHSGRVFCKNKRMLTKPWVDNVYFVPEGRERIETQYQLPEELCPW